MTMGDPHFDPNHKCQCSSISSCLIASTVCTFTFIRSSSVGSSWTVLLHAESPPTLPIRLQERPTPWPSHHVGAVSKVSPSTQRALHINRHPIHLRPPLRTCPHREETCHRIAHTHGRPLPNPSLCGCCQLHTQLLQFWFVMPSVWLMTMVATFHNGPGKTEDKPRSCR